MQNQTGFDSKSITRLIIATLVSVYFFYYSFTASQWHFIDAINLMIHEAGHTLFQFFGTFLYIAGGSLFQILVPAVFVGYFFRQREYFSSALLLFWVGQNIINVSVYASDALTLQLPLLSDDLSGHDWFNMLQMTDLLSYTDLIGRVIYTTGFIVLCVAAFLSFAASRWNKS